MLIIDDDNDDDGGDDYDYDDDEDDDDRRLLPDGKLFRFVRACRACWRGEAKLREGVWGVFVLTLRVAR